MKEDIRDAFDTLYTNLDILILDIRHTHLLLRGMCNDIFILKSDIGIIKDSVLQTSLKLDSLEAKIDQLISERNGKK